VLKRLTILFYFGQYEIIMQSCWNPILVVNGFLSFVLTISGGSSGFFYCTHESNILSNNFLASDKLVKKLSHVTLRPAASIPSSRSNTTFRQD